MKIRELFKKTIAILSVILLAISASAIQVAAAEEPSIEFTYVPAFGSFDYLYGNVTGVNLNDVDVAVYIYVSGWWVKPYFDTPLTYISGDGTWYSDITTGGIDEQATRIRAYLLPKGYNPPLADGIQDLPKSLDAKKLAVVEVERKPPIPVPTPITTPFPSAKESPGILTAGGIFAFAIALIFLRSRKKDK